MAQAVGLVVATRNVAGICSARAGLEGDAVRVAAVLQRLRREEAAVAVLSEPRLAPGLHWPGKHGYVFYGDRAASPGTVAVLVADSLQAAVAPVAQ
eukprot:6820710-Pyramimonas_sp.AAC.1